MNTIKYILIISTLLLFQTSIVELLNILDENSSNGSLSIIDETFFNISMNFQRKSFEIFYNLTNKFIDEIFKPNIPKGEYLIETNTRLKYHLKYKSFKGTVEDLIEKFIPRSTIDYVKQPYRLYPSLVYFSVGVIVTAILISFVGFSIFAYRCCCKKKISPYDQKRDSFRRKFNASIMFIILVAIM